MTDEHKATYIHDVRPGTAYLFDFTNYKEATATRHIIARGMRWGGTPWHPELQWFIDGFDLDKMEPRSFPIKLIELGTFRVMTDEEVDVFFQTQLKLTKQAGYEEGIKKAAADE